MNGDLLLVDIGNTRVKWGMAAAGVIVPGQPFASDRRDLEVRLEAYWGALPRPAMIQVANVAGGAVAEVVAEWVRRRWGVAPNFARTAAQFRGIVNGYDDPAQLGVDRWLALLGLSGHHPLPACVVDCGTALTLDIVAGDGRHLGGVIAPGPRLMGETLAVATRGTVTATVGNPCFLARNTGAGVHAGTWLACAGLVEKSLRHWADAAGRAPRLILTGGDGEELGRWLSVPFGHDPVLVLRGLLNLAENDA